MKNLNTFEKDFWNEYATKEDIPVDAKLTITSSPAGNFEITDSLIKLYREGKKRAGSGLVEDYQSAGDPLPKVGDYWLLLNSNKAPEMILKTIKTEIHKFKNLPKYIAEAEGEGDLSVDYWQKAHAELYVPHLASWGIENLEEAHVITEFFEIVHQV